MFYRKFYILQFVSILFLSYPFLTHAAPTRVGTPVSASSAAATSISVNYSPTPGNFVAVYVWCACGSATISSVTDNAGSTYSSAFNNGGATASRTLALFYTKSAASGVTTITANLPSSAKSAIIVAEYSGVDPTSPLDVVSTLSNGTGITATTNSVSPQSGDLELAFFYNFSTTAAWTATAPFSLVKGQTNTDGEIISLADQLGANTTTASATVGGSVTWNAFLATFKAATGGSPPPPPPPPPSDTTAPTIPPSSISASNITTSGATISWTTNESADTQIEYGLTTSYGSQTSLDPTLTTSHSQPLSGLSPNTTYNYRVKSRDAAGNLATSGNNTFITTAVVTPPPPPTTPPPAPTPTPTPPPGGCSATNVRCVPSEYSTIQACANAAVAGDTCLVSPGTYNESVNITRDGTTTSRITFQSTGSPAAKVRSFYLDAANYITVDGFEITDQGMTGSSSNNYGVAIYNTNTGNIISNNNIHHTNNDCVRIGSASFLTIRGGALDHCGTMQSYGYGAGISDNNNTSSDVLIDNVNMSYVSDYVISYGQRFVFRNSTIGPVDPATPIHVDGVQTNGVTSYFLMENIRSINNNNSDNHYLLHSSPTSYFIVRYGSTYLTNGETRFGCPIPNAGCGNDTGMAIYNNTFYDTNAMQPQCCFIDMYSIDNLGRNNIWYNAVGNQTYALRSNAPPGATIDKDYDLWYLQSDPIEVNDVNADPRFTNASIGDLTLQASSPAIDAGGPLTAVATGDSGSGTTLKVGKAYPFQDGWAGVPGDCIAVGTISNTACITSINYITNTITLASSITRSVGQPVWLYKDSDGTVVINGSAPDIGAFEYGVPSSPPPTTPAPVSPPTPTPSPSPALTVIPNTTGGGAVSPQLVTLPTTPITPSTPSTPTIPGITLTQTLTVGSKGTQVTLLQNYLISLGYLAQGNNDGNYGPRTQSAVQQYQCKSMNICSGSTTTNGYGMVGTRTRLSLSGGGSPQTTTGLTAAQRALIQAQINQLLILVQQLVLQLKALRGL